MSNLAAEYTKLKKLVGGNREVMGYEETFGMPREEAQYVTMPSAFPGPTRASLTVPLARRWII
mgnify:CR=1 FL=1